MPAAATSSIFTLIWGLGFRIWVWNSGLRVGGLRLLASGFGFGVWEARLRLTIQGYGLEFRVSGLRCRVDGPGFLYGLGFEVKSSWSGCIEMKVIWSGEVLMV